MCDHPPITIILGLGLVLGIVGRYSYPLGMTEAYCHVMEKQVSLEGCGMWLSSLSPFLSAGACVKCVS